MSAVDYRRKSTLRQDVLGFGTPRGQKVKKLRGKYLFRAAVRLVILYKEWILDVVEEIGQDVTANVKRAQRKKISTDQGLNLKDRATLLIPPDKRSKEDVEYIKLILREINAFKKYPGKVRDSLAAGCLYQYVPPGHTIIRQGHPPQGLYYIVEGDLRLLREETDHLTGKVQEIEIGSLISGDVFGEIALLHEIPRSATVVTKTSADLIIINKNVFDAHLRSVLLGEWGELKDALVNFNYFKGWTDETMRQCCILSKLHTFKPDEIILGDGKGKVNYVYFLLSGECRLIEHMLIEKKHVGKKVKYKMYETEEDDITLHQFMGRAAVKIDRPGNLQSLMMAEAERRLTELPGMDTAEEYMKKVAQKKSDTSVDRLSVISITLQDLIGDMHEITDTIKMLRKKPSVSTLNNYPPYVQTVFMQVCMFHRGACFALGEQMKNRRIVTITPCKFLLIPRTWLRKHNRANIWERVKHFMNENIPSDEELFRRFVENRQWAKARRKYCEDAIKKHGRIISNDTKIYNVPYATRINEDIVDELRFQYSSKTNSRE